MTRRDAQLRQRLVDHLVAIGLLDQRWRPSFADVPRHAFIPDTVWRQVVTDDDADVTPLLAPMHRADDPTAWLEHVYRNTHVVTQVDDGVPAGPGGRGLAATSSSSQPSVMAIMLGALDAEPGHRVLEVGAGTGYNAALLAHRVGAANVTTVDVDPAVAAAAAAALAATGFAGVTVVVGDGELGHPPGAPYDRVVCTAGVREVPPAWVLQTRPGGRIVAPWANLLFDGAVLTLAVRTDGRATGRLGERVSFMPLRGQRTPLLPTVDPAAGDVEVRTTDCHPDVVVLDPAVLLAVSLRVPRCRRAQQPGGVAWFVDQWSGSWAVVRPTDADITVDQRGPRRLWDEVEDAYRWWRRAGRPGLDRWRVSITPDGQSFQPR